MDSRNGDLYVSKGEALKAGVPERDVVQVIGTRRAVGRLRMAARNENNRRKTRRRQQAASRKGNR